MSGARVVLREYQGRAVDAACASLSSTRQALLSLPTGSGKSILCSAIIERMQVPSLVLVPRVALVEQMERAIPGAAVKCDTLGRNEDGRVVIATIQTAVRREFKVRPQLVVWDEAHMDTESHHKLIGGLGHPMVCGMTATPYNSSGYIYGQDKYWARPCYEVTIPHLIREGFLVKPRLSETASAFSLKGMKTQDGDWRAEDLNRLVSPGLLDRQMREALGRLEGRRACFWAAINIDHAEQIASWLASHGETAVVYHSKLGMDERTEVLDDFKAGDARHVVQVSALSTGFDHPPTDAIVLMRPTKSPALMVQCLSEDTEVLTDNGWKGIDDDISSCRVAAFDVASGRITFEDILGVVRRPLGDNESMYGVKLPGADISVTGEHRMFAVPRNGVARFFEARALATVGSFSLPCSGLGSGPGLALTDDEIRVIGWFVTDGTRGKLGNVSISQASNSVHIDDLRSALVGAGLAFSERASMPASNFRRNSPLVRFYISRRNDRLPKPGLRGWEQRLGPYLDKDLSPLIFQANERQVGIFLEACHMGDGSKQPKANWVQRSYHITKGNKLFIDRMQALALMNGWSANVSTHAPRADGYHAQYTLHLKKRLWQTFKGARAVDRAGFAVLAERPQRVWCLSNCKQTLVVRRNGKAVVVGNCIGRALRPSQEKGDALVLDFGHCVRNCGPIDRPFVRQEAGETPAQVRERLDVRVVHCEKCGEFFFPRPYERGVCACGWVEGAYRGDKALMRVPDGFSDLLDDNTPHMGEAINYHADPVKAYAAKLSAEEMRVEMADLEMGPDALTVTFSCLDVGGGRHHARRVFQLPNWGAEPREMSMGRARGLKAALAKWFGVTGSTLPQMLRQMDVRRMPVKVRADFRVHFRHGNVVDVAGEQAFKQGKFEKTDTYGGAQVGLL